MRHVTGAEGYDAEVGIVGAGPAGARAAELLATLGVEVLLWDGKAPWEKPCAGGLTAAVLRQVPELADVVPEAQPIELVRLETALGAWLEIPLERPLYVISRAVLSRWQLGRARDAGAEFVREPVRRLARTGKGWRVALGSGVERRVRCLIGADGGASLVRAVACPDFRVELAPTRVAFVAGVGPHARTIALRFARGVAGYTWSFPRPDHSSVGVVREPGTCTRADLDAEVDRLRGAEGPSGDSPVARGGAVIGTAWFPLRPGYPEIGAADLALLGDAGGLADPATGEGIHNALSSAELAIEAFMIQRSFCLYPRLAAERFDQEFRTARRIRRLLYDQDAVYRLIEAAARHRSAYALLVALVNGVNGHDMALGLPWLRGFMTATMAAMRRPARPWWTRRASSLS